MAVDRDLVPGVNGERHHLDDVEGVVEGGAAHVPPGKVVVEDPVAHEPLGGVREAAAGEDAVAAAGVLAHFLWRCKPF